MVLWDTVSVLYVLRINLHWIWCIPVNIRQLFDAASKSLLCRCRCIILHWLHRRSQQKVHYKRHHNRPHLSVLAFVRTIHNILKDSKVCLSRLKIVDWSSEGTHTAPKRCGGSAIWGLSSVKALLYLPFLDGNSSSYCL